MTRPILRVPVGFAPNAIDKVERLLEVLDGVSNDPHLRDSFVLHGGTALNLFYDDAPRLSVDIDLMYIADADVQAMRAARPEVDRRLRGLLEAVGYVVQGTNDEHSGQTYRVKYPGDYVKLDISYLARVSMLDARPRPCTLAEPEVTFPVLDERELIAGKIKAMMERIAARDIFDLYRLGRRHPSAFEDPLTRALTIRAVSLSNPFPIVVDPAVSLGRFGSVGSDFTEPLIAMLRPTDVVPFDEMLTAVESWLGPLSSLTASEIEYVRLLDDEARDAPELLFSAWPDTLDRARRDPVMAWKVQNLRKRAARG